MKSIYMIFVYIFLSVSVISCSESDKNSTSEKQDTLRDRVHAQMELVEKEMNEIKNITDPTKRKVLLGAHQPNMSKLLAMYKQLQTDKSVGASGGQSALMVDIMFAQIKLYESVMNDIDK